MDKRIYMIMVIFCLCEIFAPPSSPEIKDKEEKVEVTRESLLPALYELMSRRERYERHEASRRRNSAPY